jgi:hypothetical protein
MARDLTVGELVHMLSDFGEDTVVRFAHQPGYPMQLRIAHDVAHRSSRDSITKILYLLEAGQPSDAPYAPANIFNGEHPGELEDPDDAGRCPDCGEFADKRGYCAC